VGVGGAVKAYVHSSLTFIVRYLNPKYSRL
jgi:hypothetical protein